jgi:hypothetical protein
MTEQAAASLLPQAFSASKLCVPTELRLKNGWLLWEWRNYMGSARGREVAADGLLVRFLKIRKAEDVYRFARRFGPLGICQHGRPVCHAVLPGGGALYEPGEQEETRVDAVSPPSPEAFYCAPKLLPDDQPEDRINWFLGRLEKREPVGSACGERVNWWLNLSEVMRAALNVAEHLKRAARPQRRDLALLNKFLVHGVNPLPIIRHIFPEHDLAKEAELYGRDGDVLASVEEARADGLRSRAWELVLELLNEWLVACPMRIYFTYTDSRPVDFSMSFIAGDQRGCFPALVFELIERIRSVQGNWMVRCTHCKVLVSPRREPREGGRVFCPSCRTGGWPVRYANRDHYARNSKQILDSRRRKRRTNKT